VRFEGWEELDEEEGAYDAAEFAGEADMRPQTELDDAFAAMLDDWDEDEVGLRLAARVCVCEVK
jgi:hypothetical protein